MPVESWNFYLGKHRSRNPDLPKKNFYGREYSNTYRANSFGDYYFFPQWRCGVHKSELSQVWFIISIPYLFAEN
jgi:hypothetical protein